MIGQEVVLVLVGMAAGVAASLVTGLAVRVALGGRAQVAPVAAAVQAFAPPALEADHEQDIAIALAAISGFAKSR